ncbi:hypothetical protein [Butyrivibrio sp. FC2001]|nr:hypothetical protein [Butyrivibrio sp. FC2001]
MIRTLLRRIGVMALTVSLLPAFISFGNEEWTDWTEAIDHIDD